METKITEQERNNFQKGSGNSMIFYGVLTSIISIFNAILIIVFIKLNIDINYTFLIWCLMIPAVFVGHLIDKKVKRETLVKTHSGSIMSAIWNCYLFSICIFLIILFIIGIGKQFYYVFNLINPVILILLGFAEFISAKTYRFKPYLHGAVVMWIGTFVCTALLWSPQPAIFQLLVMAFCMVYGFVIPGYQLNKLTPNRFASLGVNHV
jgi:hypothetical protein